MKPIRFILAAAFALCLLVVVRAAQLTVNIGTSANDGTGDTLRSAFGKVNTNFTELYGYIGSAGLVAHDGTVALLQAENPTNARVSIVHGYNSRGDYGGGIFVPTNTISGTNRYWRIVSSSYPTWSWERVVPVYEYGISNINIGALAGTLSGTGGVTTSNNFFFGPLAGANNTVGYYSIVIGTVAGTAATNLTATTLFGHRNSEYIKDGETTASYGYRGFNQATNFYDTVGIGYRHGHNSAYVLGSNLEGSQAGYEVLLPTYSIAHGFYALRDATNSYQLQAHGIEALRFGAQNTNSIALGYQAGRTDTNGLGNLWIGWATNPSGGSSWTNAAAIGNFATVATNNFLMLGNQAQKIGIGTNWGPFRFDVLDTNQANYTVARIRRNIQGLNATMGFAYGTPYLNIGGLENRNNSIQTIGFGYKDNNDSISPAEIGYRTTDVSSYTKGSLVFATRNVTTSSAPSERMTIEADGDVAIGATTSIQTGYTRSLTLSAGTSGNNIGAIEVQGSRTTTADFGTLDFYHQTNLVATVTAYRNAADDAGGLRFYQRATGGSLLVGMEIDSDRVNISGSGLRVRRIATGISYQALVDDYYVGCTAGGITITLPAVANMPSGCVMVIKDESGTASGSNITIDGNASETIDGAATATIGTNYGAVRLISNGSAWFTM
jgi:hypothetical protein